MDPQTDKSAAYTRGGFGHHLGFGTSPALAVIDLQVGYTDPELSSQAANLDHVIEASNRLIAAARQARVPVIFTVIGYDPDVPEEAGLWAEKIPALHELKLGGALVELDSRLDHRVGDLVIVKKCASAFSGTHLASTLTTAQIDTLIVAGCTTSGCVRATVMEALFAGFRPIVPREAVGDRAEEPHVANLFDMDMKYADVVPLTEVLDYLSSFAGVTV